MSFGTVREIERRRAEFQVRTQPGRSQGVRIHGMRESESDLVRRCARGEEAAYRELVERVEKPLVNFVRRYLDDASSAEDVFQETFVRVVRTLGDFKPEASLSTWIFTIARNLCLDRIKMKRRHREVSLDEGQGGRRPGLIDFRDALRATGTTPEQDLDAREEGRRLQEAIGKLSPNKREALVLRQYSGLSYQEIAAIVDAPVGTVKFRVHEAIQDLMKLLGASGAERREEVV